MFACWWFASLAGVLAPMESVWVAERSSGVGGRGAKHGTLSVQAGSGPERGGLEPQTPQVPRVCSHLCSPRLGPSKTFSNAWSLKGLPFSWRETEADQERNWLTAEGRFGSLQNLKRKRKKLSAQKSIFGVTRVFIAESMYICDASWSMWECPRIDMVNRYQRLVVHCDTTGCSNPFHSFEFPMRFRRNDQRTNLCTVVLSQHQCFRIIYSHAPRERNNTWESTVRISHKEHFLPLRGHISLT